MKRYLPATLALACTLLVIFLIVMKRGDDAQHENDAGAIADFSNQLDSAQLQIATGVGTIVTLSNRLDESRSASLTFSNQLIEAESTIALDTEQITSLNRHIAGVESENQTLGQRVMDLTNQTASLAGQFASTKASLDELTKGSILLEDRFRRDMAERVVAERKFNNLSELQAQMEYLKKNPAKAISAEGIFKDLDIVVKSNTFYISSPD
jgi:chromosome segregation ATPase